MFGSVTTAAQLMVKVGADVEEAQRKLNGMSKEFDTLKSAGTKMAMGVTAGRGGCGRGYCGVCCQGDSCRQ